MQLLHPLQNRFFQFSLAMMELLGKEHTLSRSLIEELGEEFRLNPMEIADTMVVLSENCLIELLPDNKRWTSCKLLKEQTFDGTYKLLPQMPAGILEKEYLQYILGFSQVHRFLDEDTIKALSTESSSWYQTIHRLFPQGETASNGISKEAFTTLLTAILEGRYIQYSYRTKLSSEYVQTTAVPWKLEHSVYDRRWWLILYDPVQNRCIKSFLTNLEQIRLGEPHDFTEDDILKAMEDLKIPEPVVLQVTDIRNGLERCFLQFETQEIIETKNLGDNRYELSFVYYRFETEEIMRKLMSLGTSVTLIGPESLKEAFRERLRSALD